MLIQIVQNVSLLVLVALSLFPLISRLSGESEAFRRSIIIGVVLGLSAFLVSSLPIQIPDGSVVDSRAGPMVFAGYLGGPVAALIAAAIGGIARYLQGGAFWIAGAYGYFAYALLGAAYAWYRTSRGQDREITPVTTAILIVLSWFGTMNAYWLIWPAEIANSWFRDHMIYTLASSAIAAVVVAISLRFVMDTIENRQRVAQMAERLDLATKSVGIGIWDYVMQSGETRWNDQQYRLHGVDPETFSPDFENWLSCVHHDDRSKIVVSVKDAVDGTAAFDTEYRVETGTGEIRHLRAKGEVLRDASGQAERMLGVNFDHSLLRQAEREAKEDRQRLETTADSLPGAIVQYSQTPNGSERIDYLSAGSADIWGLSAEQLGIRPERLWSMVDDSHAKMLRDAIESSARDLRPWRAVWRINRPDGISLWLNGRGSPRRGPDGTVTWSMVVLDITDQVETKSELASSQELFFNAQKLDALGKLTGGVAHDFNNLLAVIMGNLELIRGNMDEQQLELYDDALDACERGARLTQQLLSFSRQATLKPEALDLNEVVANSERLLRRTLPENIKIESVRLGGLWTARVDPAFLENALLNLALNARDAMPEGGVLTLETANVRLGQEYIDSRQEDVAPGRYVMIAVSDDGCGMSPDVVRGAFEPFFTTKPPGQGSGMGLSMVHGFVKQSKGITRLYSEPAAGTTIKMFFPTVDMAVVEPDPPETELLVLTGDEHVVLVEDDQKVRTTVTRQLLRMGYRVTSFPNGEGVVEAVGADPTVSILLSDVVMPGPMQGPALARAVREVRPELPVIFISGYPQEAAINLNGLESGDLQLMKPVSNRDLARALRTTLTKAYG